MTLLSKLRLVTVDVTGTLIAYKGQLGDYYCMAAKSAGMPCPDYKRMHEGFKAAYTEMTVKHPCFGHASNMPNIDWWKMCVKDSFIRAGYEYDDATFEKIFRRIYCTFGSSAPYTVFPDAQEFLRWLRSNGCTVGIVSNAEYRYKDVVLPALGINQGSEWDFGVFSGIAGVEKPDRRVYEAALEMAGGVAAAEALHIGDSMRKDYAPARGVGMHALLLDRFRTAEAESWRRSGAAVLPDLVAAREWLLTAAGVEEQPIAAGRDRRNGNCKSKNIHPSTSLREWRRGCCAVAAARRRQASSSAAYAAATATASASSSSHAALEELAAGRKGLARVVLKKGRTQIFRDGSPMVYSGAVDRIIGRPPPKTGDVVLVADGAEKPIGWGLYNSVSMFCVRLMQLEEEAKRDPTCALNMERLLEARILSAVDLRRSLGLPSVHANAYRLINSEGDRLSGLIVDIFADVAVIASSAAWVEKYRHEIQFLVNKVSDVNHIKWRSSTDILKEEGLDVSEQKELEPSSHRGTVEVMENDVLYLVSLEGQKTGFYADQRENRHFIATLSDGQRVLDLCCYIGGFALNAAKGGANNVIGIDSSASALDLANKNILLNKLDTQRISFVKEDATTFMKGAISRNEVWDLVILDPPKLAPRKKVLQSASGMYRSLNALAMQVVKPGGLLITCSCSGAMTQSGLFLRTIQQLLAPSDVKEKGSKAFY